MVCYCAMLGCAATMPATTSPLDRKCVVCIAVPAPHQMSKAALGLADVIEDFGIGDEKAVAMLKALHSISAV